jgi:hypothetical protein
VGKDSVAELVSAVMEEMGFLQLPLENDLINYSALARFIKPAVEEKMGGRKASMDSLIMAVRRYAKAASGKDENSETLRVLAGARIILRTGMVLLHLRRTSELYSKIIELERKYVNWHQGDKMYVLQRSEEIMVATGRKFLPLIKAEVDRDDILLEYDALALLTIEYDREANMTPGVLAFVSNQLDALGINVYAIFNSVTKLSLLVSEAQAARLYDRLNRMLEQSRTAVERGR